MNQLSYIIKGIFLLLCLVSGGYFINVVANTETVALQSKPEMFCGTVMPSSFATTYPLGKTLFLQKCASCHSLLKDVTGPALTNVLERHTWADPKELRAWIRNPSEYMKRDVYTKQLKAKYGSMMQGFPDLTDNEIDQIIGYINQFSTNSVY